VIKSKLFGGKSIGKEKMQRLLLLRRDKLVLPQPQVAEAGKICLESRSLPFTSSQAVFQRISKTK